MGILSGIALVLTGSWALTAPFIDDFKTNDLEEALDVEDFDKYGKYFIMFGTVVALASLYGLIVCYLGQYYPMIAYCIYLIAGTVLMIIVSVYIGINFTEIKQNTRNEASRMWKLTKASTAWMLRLVQCFRLL